MPDLSRAIQAYRCDLTGLLRSVCFFVIAVSLGFSAVYTYTRVLTPTPVTAATSSNLNYQARLLNANGSVVPDGYYNIEFKIHSALTGGSVLWTEAHIDTDGAGAAADNRVRVKNGYLSVNLNSINNNWGSITNWDTDMWMTMNVGGTAHTGSPTYDGEMSPRIKLTGVPYAMAASRADTLDGIDSTAFAQLGSTQTFTGVNTFSSSSTAGFILQDTAGTPDVLFKADTTNNRIVVGNATATTGANTTLLVVDSAALTANLPVGVNGGIVYDDQADKFKIFENGAWKILCNMTDLSCGAGGGGTVNDLQDAYDGSTNPEIVLDSTRGGLTVRDNSTPLGANLLEVQNNGGTKSYLAVSATGTIIRTENDSATALQVQNSDGSTFLTADTVNKQLFVRGGSGYATYGPYLVNDADFTDGSWTSTGWTVSSTQATHNTGNTNSLSTNSFTPVPGATYEVYYDVSGTTSTVASLTVSMGGNTVYPSGGAGNWPANSVLLNPVNTTNLAFASQSGWDGTISNVFVRRVMDSAKPAIVVEDSSGTAVLEVLASPDNTMLGLYAGQNNSTGISNTALGNSSMMFNVGGSYNTAIGESTLVFNRYGSNNTALGFATLANNGSGNSNTAIGSFALQANVNGSDNIGIGESAGASITTGSNNIVIGNNIDVADGDANYQLNIGDLLMGYMDQGILGIGVQPATTGSALQVAGGVQAVSLNAAAWSADLAGTLVYDSTAGKFFIYDGTARKELCNKTDLACATGSTLQNAYDSSSNPELVLDATRGALTIRDNSTPIGASLFEVQNNAGTASYLSVAANGTTLKTGTDSATALQVLSSANEKILGVDTTSGNLITNPGFETNTTGYQQRQFFVTLTRVTTDAYMGDASLKVDTSATLGDGFYYDVALSPNTQYTLSIYMKADSNSFVGDFGYMYTTGNDTGSCSDYIITTEWKRYTCTWTTNGTTNPAQSKIFFRQDAATARTFYVDNVRLEAGATASAQPGKIQLNGAVSGPVSLNNTFNSAEAFQIQNSSGASLFTADTANSKIEVAGDIYSTGLKWTGRQHVGIDKGWDSITYGNGMFVAVGNNGTGQRVMTSQDGISWTLRTSPADNYWSSVTYGNGMFVAVAQSGTNRVMTSPDGINWTLRSAAAANTWQNVIYASGQFVAVSYDGSTSSAMTSPDGVNWTIRTTPNDGWLGITYGNGTFVAVSNVGTNRVMTSPDGVTWTAQTAAAANQWIDVTYGKGLFVAVAASGTNDRVMTSPDGVTWTSRFSAVDNPWDAVTYGQGLFVAVAGSGGCDRLMTSPDGINWTTRTSTCNYNWEDIGYGNGMFIAVSGAELMTSGHVIELLKVNNNTYQGGMTVYGSSIYKSDVNSTTAFQIQNAAGSSNLFVADTQNGRIGIGTASPSALLHVSGDGSTTLFKVTDTTATAQDVFTIANGGDATFRSQTDSDNAFRVQNSAGNNVLEISTQDSTVGINLQGATPLSALDVRGSLTLSGTVAVNFLTPGGSNVPTRINIPIDPSGLGSSEQVLAFGLHSLSHTNARAISVFDARTVAHQPSIGVFSPNESNILGFSWEGSNTDSYVKATAGNIHIRSGTTDIASFNSNGTAAIAGKLTLNGSGNPTTSADGLQLGGDVNLYRSGGSSLTSNSQIGVVRGTATDTGFATAVTGDTNDRFKIDLNGQLQWGPGNASADTNLYRSAASTLKTDDSFHIQTSSTSAFMVQGTSDTIFTADSSGNQLKVGNDTGSAAADYTLFVLDKVAATANLPVGTNGGMIYDDQVDKFKIYENGAWKTLCNTTDLGCGAAGSSLAKNAMDTSSASVTAASYLYGFTNSNTASTGGVLSLNNGSNTGNTLGITTSGNPGAGNALIFASNTNASPSGNLIDLQSGASPTSRFRVSADGDLALTGLNGSLNVDYNGNTTITSQAMDNALVVKNSEGTSSIKVGTNANVSNLITNASFEVNTSGWTTFGSGTGLAISAWSNGSYIGDKVLRIITASTAANTGASVTQAATGFADALVPGTYTLSFMAKADTSFSTFSVTTTGGGAPSCLSGQTLTTSYKRFSCQFTSTSTNITAINFITTNSTQRTIYIDALRLAESTTDLPYSAGAIQLNGTITSPTTFQNANNSNNAFQILQETGDYLFTADTASNRLKVGNDTGSAASDYTLFILDKVGSTANLPVGTNGGMIYDDQVDKFKIYENGAWKTLCNTTDLGCGTGGEAYLANNQTFTGTNLFSNTNATAFKVQNASAAALLTADTSTMKVVVGDATNGISLSSTGMVLSGTARNAKKIVLTPEYEGAVLYGDTVDNTGTMTAKYDPAFGNNGINYYNWTTTQTSSQDYDIVIRMAVPSDWSAWAASNAFNIETWSNDGTDANGTVTVISTNGTTDVNAASITPSSDNNWDLSNPSNLTSSSIYVAGDVMTIKLHLVARNDGTDRYFRVGNITLNYLSKY